jgi:deoxyadenosine/deoxycytidine kinase
MAPRIASIEGNIGAGKSSLLDFVRRELASQPTQDGASTSPRVVFMQEPVDLWETVKDSVTGETILSKFYRDPATYAFPFQVMAYTSRLAAFQRVVAEHPDCDWIVCERSLEADRHIFAEMLSDDDQIDEVMFRVYMMLYENTAHAFPVNVAFYLDADPATCLQRIERRARPGEAQISLDYLTKCKEYHDRWMADMELRQWTAAAGATSADSLAALTEVIRLDGNQEVDYRGVNASSVVVAQQWTQTIVNRLTTPPTAATAQGNGVPANP